MNDLINETAALIRTYNPALADAFLTQPFRRVTLARGFAAGFGTDDVHPTAVAVLRVAYMDRDAREALA